MGVAYAPWFISRKDGEPRGLSVAMVDYLVRSNALAAGLEGVHAHALRHSAASHALASGANLVAVRDLMGHASITSTSRYLHATSDAVIAPPWLA